ncbi:hypothetical protein [Streptomyces sp. AM8-1-1]|uniref:hypothetical protein n=1 Tax=Streptomyces sp. AM8-1-1 TaxID=3075825 RepID=UPI0028C3F2CF|nr:hypothetical protein [Streptomyces sp. AM8-1-1]WNO76815.1 hypothetical protein RPQ07_36595 [Streptomyces sp. AM8-1-1]
MVVLDQTQAFAIVALALGHRRSVAALRQSSLAFNTPWGRTPEPACRSCSSV